MITSPLLLARRTVNELGEMVETRPLTPYERGPKDGDVLAQPGSSQRYKIIAYSSLDGGYYLYSMPHMASVRTFDKSFVCDPESEFYYVSRFDGEPVAVELYPPRPMTTAERLPKKGGKVRSEVWNYYQFEEDVSADKPGCFSVMTFHRVSRRKKGSAAIGLGWILDKEHPLFYVSRADGGPVTVSTRPAEAVP